MRELLSFLQGISKPGADEQIRKANGLANNKGIYTRYGKKYGLDDYLAAPKQFLINNGDFEDYVIIKMPFKQLGFDDN